MRLRRSRPQVAADDYRKVSGRSSGLEYAGGSAGRRAGCDRRNLRTIPDADWIPEPHSPRAGGEAAGVRTLWHLAEPKAELVVLVPVGCAFAAALPLNFVRKTLKQSFPVL